MFVIYWCVSESCNSPVLLQLNYHELCSKYLLLVYLLLQRRWLKSPSTPLQWALTSACRLSSVHLQTENAALDMCMTEKGCIVIRLAGPLCSRRCLSMNWKRRRVPSYMLLMCQHLPCVPCCSTSTLVSHLMQYGVALNLSINTKENHNSSQPNLLPSPEHSYLSKSVHSGLDQCLRYLQLLVANWIVAACHLTMSHSLGSMWGALEYIFHCKCGGGLCLCSQLLVRSYLVNMWSGSSLVHKRRDPADQAFLAWLRI